MKRYRIKHQVRLLEGVPKYEHDVFLDLDDGNGETWLDAFNTRREALDYIDLHKKLPDDEVIE